MPYLLTLYIRMDVHQRIAFKAYLRWYGRQRITLQEYLKGWSIVQEYHGPLTVSSITERGLQLSGKEWSV
ncbi:hypothetical protein C943_03307 [Mariniradius saccharolyticus AK6]|uniref:Uncharacterized protein n=1 Tax=Mariniradius saccharolyticus AK6 TaxID=1239962 RepID=M7XB09_9BACT|nr:hypothetical protein C943_03307 [Mariniradius saccharolyticus AK6]